MNNFCTDISNADKIDQPDNSIINAYANTMEK